MSSCLPKPGYTWPWDGVQRNIESAGGQEQQLCVMVRAKSVRLSVISHVSVCYHSKVHVMVALTQASWSSCLPTWDLRPRVVRVHEPWSSVSSQWTPVAQRLSRASCVPGQSRPEAGGLAAA